ncbi:MAG: porin [Gammaproteobacteria bacterium]|nr:porin [Gammaproteobacteria bacterium]MBU1447339.1 porin [Gammaproteobacteria bacterium]MDD2928346.1 porin [Sideroxydans sp.]MDD5472415.1 porin [Sideroxydans sp.]
MQKKIIALAVAAAFSAPAFADVTANGIVDAAIISASGSGQKSDMIAYSGGLSTSRLSVTATEGLDNGWTAIGLVEYGIDTQDNGSTLTARKKMLAVAGDFGTVATGYLQTTGYDLAVKFDPTAGSAVSPLQNVTKGAVFLMGTSAEGARGERAVAYISPKFNDLVFAVNYSTSLVSAVGGNNLGNLTQTADNKHTAFLASANYEKGPLAVGGAYATLTAAGSEAAKEYMFGASYDLGTAKVMGTYQSRALTGGATDKAYSFSAVAPVGAGAVVASYAANKMQAAASSATSITLGYLQNLSKTVTGYAAYSSVSQDANTNVFSVAAGALSAASLNNGGSSSLIAVGLRKKF